MTSRSLRLGNSRLKFEGRNLLLQMVKDVEIVHKWSSFCTNSLRSSSYNDGNNSHNYSQFIGKGKSAWNTFKVTTIQVYCLRLSNLSHSLRCTFLSLLSFLCALFGLKFFLALIGLKQSKTDFVVTASLRAFFKRVAL